jgi:WD40 repeat protein
MLASGGWDGAIRLWRVSDGALLRTITGHTNWVNCIAFSPNGRILASGGEDRTLRLWRVSDGAQLQLYDRETGKSVRSIQFSPDGRLLAYGRLDATVVVARNPFWRIRGDVNHDGCVDDADLLQVLFAFGRSGSGLPEDLNNDGTVDDADLLEVLFHFGEGC